MKRLSLIFALLFSGLFMGSSVASQSPQALVEETSQLMLAKLKEEQQIIKEKPERIYDLVNEIVIPHFDFEYMSQMVLAKYWRRASAGQKKAFTKEFRQLLVRTYATSLNEYAEQEIIYLPFRASSREDYAIVRTEIDQPGGFPIPINYKLRKNSEWKVFDVVIDGVSLVTNYRTSFAKEIRQSGLDDLIKTLAKRNKQASNG
jgi:phospholipid transport system substrate-binding protein